MAEPAVAVLAAGRSVRFGGPKLETSCLGKPLGRWAIDAVEQAGLRPGMIITAPEGVSFAEGWAARINLIPEVGLGSSLALAAHLALEEGATSLLVLLADMPLVTPEHLRALIAAPAPAATRYPLGRAGVPAVLDRALMEQAARLDGDRGAGPLLVGASLIDPPAEMIRDVDTPADLYWVERILAGQPHPPG